MRKVTRRRLVWVVDHLQHVWLSASLGTIAVLFVTTGPPW